MHRDFGICPNLQMRIHSETYPVRVSLQLQLIVKNVSVKHLSVWFY